VEALFVKKRKGLDLAVGGTSGKGQMMREGLGSRVLRGPLAPWGGSWHYVKWYIEAFF
jgi:hypothetical protein